MRTRTRLSLTWLETRDNPSGDIPGVDPLGGVVGGPTAPADTTAVQSAYIAPTNPTYDVGADALIGVNGTVTTTGHTDGGAIPYVPPVGSP